ncbi:HTH-type transcriptional regulator MetR [Aliiroseovarius sp. xm-m-379]|uniref:HTH-type transcriptional regulator MetR n=1 Tax=Aliiroseovarius crassostreae TaxID=154981 RepID=A0A0P7IWP4_9RHOB|nr:MULTISPECIES: LysR family transcriptional regulator [Aliiroseovarius]KPN63079.1 XRE family transcriptional regulator [Aliiroseovarius crassostreae]NRP11414.1 HTH-type transcriptional regulator MetR [Aliiroseovarius sp. xm-d-517]NRP23907.1 HTH-type transcriptional regulator MetR [Aliiroseovarius sp. xm-m-379]NRP28846.1 HTH-type transcriptional regulator MetR [Aliiroseovarius sp. xm-m-314]NRP32706.1 HTH-type transcriptional regulator MetR [Aliiroseovarius sp. xm-a-104]
MYLEFRHLRTIRAIHQAGNLARAADMLHITQSALSHQIKGLEDQVGMELFHRRTKPMKLSPAGMKLLRLSERVLPEIAAVEEEFRALQEGRSGRLHIAIECHACFDWLFPVLDKLRHAWPEVDLDIRQRLAFDAIEALRREEVDLVITSDPVEMPGITFSPLFDYEPRFVAASGHPLADRPFIEAEDFEEELVLTYPVERAKIDLFTALLTPARVEPRAVRQVEMTEMILMLVGAGRGVAVMPDWVLRSAKTNPDFVTKRLTANGLFKRMYAATREEDTMVPFMAHMLRLCRSEPVKLQR